MCFFQLEAMIKSARIVPFTVSTSLKNESLGVRIVPFAVSTSLKNESVSQEHSSFSCVKHI